MARRGRRRGASPPGGERRRPEGAFRPGASELEWCNRRLLARIHRLTLGRLRREIEPVAPSDFMRFLFRWQRVAPGTRLFGEQGLGAVLEQLQGFESAAVSWESAILPLRVADYKAAYLDSLCLSGRLAWGRVTIPSASDSEDEEAPGAAARSARARSRQSRFSSVKTCICSSRSAARPRTRLKPSTRAFRTLRAKSWRSCRIGAPASSAN